MPERDLEHLVGRRHLQVERHRQFGRQPGDISVGDVPPVLAQVGGDPVRPGLARQQRRPHRIGAIPAASVPDGRDMVDIDPEAQRATHRRAARQEDKGGT